MNYSIIPEFSDLKRTLDISEKYNTCFEYNDFCEPSVYDDEKEIEKRIEKYIAIDRSRSGDTMHGAFLGVDIAAADKVLCERSRQLCIQSLEIAERLNIKGVVFHTGLIGGLRLSSYLNNWINQAVDFWTKQCISHPDLFVYVENSFEQEPDVFVRLMKEMKDVPNFRICLDYGHAILTSTPIEIWVERLAPYIGHIHLNDNDLKDDLHLVPGEGLIDFMKWKKLIEAYGIDTSVLLELKGLDKSEQALSYMEKLYEK